MKKLLLILMLVSVGCWAEKYNTWLDSRGTSTYGGTIVWDTMIARLNNGSTYTNHSSAGSGVNTFNYVVSYRHNYEYYIDVDGANAFILGQGVNNSLYGLSNLLDEYQDIWYIDLYYKILKSKVSDTNFILESVPPSWYSSQPSDSTRYLTQLLTKRKNEFRKKYAAYRGIKYANSYDTLVDSATWRIKSIYNSDGIHYSAAGSAKLGNIFATCKPIIYPKETQLKVFTLGFTQNNYTSSNVRLHRLNLALITDTAFWNAFSMSGSNFNLYINGVKVQRYLDNFMPLSKKGVVYFASAKISSIQVKTNDTTNVNDSSFYSSCKVVRHYPFSDQVSWPILKDRVSAKNTTISRSTTSCYVRLDDTTAEHQEGEYIYSTGVCKVPPLSELSNKQKGTFLYWIKNYSVGWAALKIWMTYRMQGYTSAENSWKVRVDGYNNTWQADTNVLKTAYTTGWNRVALIYDFTQSNQVDKVKLIINGIDMSSGATASSFNFTSFGDINDSLEMFTYKDGAYSQGPMWDDIVIMDDALTVDEAINDYLLHLTGNFTVTTRSSTTRSRWSAYKQAYKSACKPAWR